MDYNLNYYNNKAALNRDKYFKEIDFAQNKLDTNRIFFEYILQFTKLAKPKYVCKILDLGTGTGYVPRVLGALIKSKFELIGIDLSKCMIKLASNNNTDNRIIFKLADNKKLPFNDNKFDIVTNKLATQFDIKEVARVLKSDGIFVFKEYGQYKGFKEIHKIFKNRYNKIVKQPNDYMLELEQAGFSEIILQKFLIKREYSLKEIDQIFEMANLIINYSSKDLAKIEKNLVVNDKIRITSDPFVIYAKK